VKWVRALRGTGGRVVQGAARALHGAGGRVQGALRGFDLRSEEHMLVIRRAAYADDAMPLTLVQGRHGRVLVGGFRQPGLSWLAGSCIRSIDGHTVHGCVHALTLLNGRSLTATTSSTVDTSSAWGSKGPGGAGVHPGDEDDAVVCVSRTTATMFRVTRSTPPRRVVPSPPLPPPPLTPPSAHPLGPMPAMGESSHLGSHPIGSAARGAGYRVQGTGCLGSHPIGSATRGTGYRVQGTGRLGSHPIGSAARGCTLVLLRKRDLADCLGVLLSSYGLEPPLILSTGPHLGPHATGAGVFVFNHAPAMSPHPTLAPTEGKRAADVHSDVVSLSTPPSTVVAAQRERLAGGELLDPRPSTLDHAPPSSAAAQREGLVGGRLHYVNGVRVFGHAHGTSLLRAAVGEIVLEIVPRSYQRPAARRRMLVTGNRAKIDDAAAAPPPLERPGVAAPWAGDRKIESSADSPRHAVPDDLLHQVLDYEEDSVGPEQHR